MTLRRRIKPETEKWAEAMPATPLAQHLVFLHSLLLDLGAAGDTLKIAEHSLKEIAVFTRTTPPYHTPQAPDPNPILTCSHCGGVGHTIRAHF